MGSKKTASKTFAPKATFTVETVKGQRVFTAVNKRAHSVCKRLGKRRKLTAKELKSTKGLGSYRMYQYVPKGTDKYAGLKAIKV